MSTTRNVGLCALAVAAALGAGPWGQTVRAATMIAVGNGSFEMPDTLGTAPYPDSSVSAGGTQTGEAYTSQTATTGHNAANGDAVPYWTVTTDATNTTNGAADGTVESYGVDNPVGWKVKNSVYSDTEYYGTNGSRPDGQVSNGVYSGLTQSTDYSFNRLAAIDSSYGYASADGYQFAYMNTYTTGSHTATFTYDPADTLGAGSNPMVSLGNFIPGDTYTLTFAVGTRLDKTQWAYSGTLLDNGVAVGVAATGNSPSSHSSSWATATYTWTATDSGAIGIELDGTGTNTQINFDNVQLSYVAPVPEPASLSLLGISAAALLIRRKRKA